MTEIKITTDTKEITLKILGESERPLTWKEAKGYCKKLGGRLPTVQELHIISALQEQGLIDTNYSGDFWSSTESNSIYAYTVGLGNGLTYNGFKYDHFWALLLGND